MSLLDVSEAFDDLVEPIQVETYSSGTRVKGIWVDGALVVNDTEAVVQPASNEDITVLNIEGETSGSFKKFYSKYDFHIANEGRQTISDIVRYRGGRFKVLSITDWAEIGNYKKVMTEKLEEEV